MNKSYDTQTKIPVSEPIIPKKAYAYIKECLDGGWISSQGRFIPAFEKKFAAYIGRKKAITTTSGTAALHLALASLKLKKDDEVILPTFTMIAPLLAVLYVGATPVLVDCEPDTWNINVSQVEEKITKKTKAIVAVHIY